MRNIANLTDKSKVKEAWAISNALAHEPISTELATKLAVKILDVHFVIMKKKGPQDENDRACHWHLSRD
jgi:hypothetical protein